MTRTFYDIWGKRFWSAVVDEHEIEAEVPVETESMRIDLVVRRGSPLSSEVREVVGVASSILGEVACLELFSGAPSVEAVARSRRKHLGFRGGALERPWPWLWVLCAGRPDALLASDAWEPLAGGPAGFYALRTVEPVRIVVLPELPRSPETLFLRLMGRASTLRAALDELEAMPAQTPMRRLALPIVMAFRLDLLQRGLVPQQHDQEFVMHILEHSRLVVEEFQEQLRLKVIQEVREEVRGEVREEVRGEAFAEGEALTLGRVLSRRLGRPITEAELHALLDWISTTDRDAATDEVCDLPDAEAAEAWLSGLARR